LSTESPIITLFVRLTAAVGAIGGAIGAIGDGECVTVGGVIVGSVLVGSVELSARLVTVLMVLGLAGGVVVMVLVLRLVAP
jgi:hypothetical protein